MSKTSLKVETDDNRDEIIEEEPASPATNKESPSTTSEAGEAAAALSSRRLSISLRSLAYSVVVAVLAVTVGVLAWLYTGAQNKLDTQAVAVANEQRAEEVALEYAVNAAQMNYKDFAAWKVKLVNNTTPELNDKLGRAATDMEQVLAPLQWDSTARPLAAAVRTNSGGIYVVDTFVSVLTKTMQAPEGMQSTATYGITVDSKNNWQISDVGGIDAVLGSN